MRNESVVLVSLVFHTADQGGAVTGNGGKGPYLQDVVVLRALGNSDLLGDGQRVHEVLIGDVMQLLTVICKIKKGDEL